MSVCSFQGTCLTDGYQSFGYKNQYFCTRIADKIILFYSGSHLLSHAVSSIVPSASWVLTIVFGMGTGVSPRRIATGSLVINSFLITKQYNQLPYLFLFLRKEVIQPRLPIRLPCYDCTPIIEPTFGRAPLAVRLRTSGVPFCHGVTGGVYKAGERIHRAMADARLLANPTSWGRVPDPQPNTRSP